MNNINKHNEARKYLVKDTSNWNKEASALALFLHDLKYHGGDTAVTSYNHYRDLGYSADPVAIYRLRLFSRHPFALIKARDFLGLLTFLLILLVLILLPSTFILPVYFVGHRWKLITPEKIKNTIWGLKSFWWVGAGYFIASFVALMPLPEYINGWINWTTVTAK